MARFLLLGVGMENPYSLTARQLRNVIVDCDLELDEAFGDEYVAAQDRQMHMRMKRYLHLMSVYYWGYDDQLHRGQLLVHRQLADAVERAFVGMFRLEFPIQSVIPASQFGYNDEHSMQRNNSSCYRPDRLKGGKPSQHFKGLATDVNPWDSPMVFINDDGELEVHPAGAHYDPSAPGAITADGPVRAVWRRQDFESGAGWGDPNDPDFFQAGFYDYQHFEPFEHLLSSIDLPAGF